MPSNWLVEKQSELGNFPCPVCDKFISEFGQHWRHNESCRPNINNYQHNIIVGLLMGDGCLAKRSDKNPHLRVGSISKNYLQYLDDKIFPAIGRGVVIERTEKESAKKAIDSGLYKASGNESNYNKFYRWRTCVHPELSKYRDWYTNNGKIWPHTISLTPETLKHWYCGDGSLSGTSIRIHMSNEYKNKEKVEQYFENAGLPKPDKWYDNIRTDGVHQCHAAWNKDKSIKLLQYMGKPLPDFEYKWDIDYV